MLKILTVVIVTFAPLTDVTFGYSGQPKLFEHLDFGISMESRGMDEAAMVAVCVVLLKTSDVTLLPLIQLLL